jgi:cell division protein FtsB
VTSTAKPRGKGKAGLSTRWVTLLSLAVGLVLVVLLLFSHREIYQVYHLRQEKSRLDAEIHRLAEENLRLARTIDRLQHDPEMIQDLIRRELNFVKKNEIIIQLPPREKDQPVKAALIPPRLSAETKGKTDKIRPWQRPRQTQRSSKTAR